MQTITTTKVNPISPNINTPILVVVVMMIALSVNSGVFVTIGFEATVLETKLIKLRMNYVKNNYRFIPGDDNNDVIEVITVVVDDDVVVVVNVDVVVDADVDVVVCSSTNT